jgi:hypothetical protein
MNDDEMIIKEEKPDEPTKVSQLQSILALARSDAMELADFKKKAIKTSFTIDKLRASLFSRAWIAVHLQLPDSEEV